MLKITRKKKGEKMQTFITARHFDISENQRNRAENGVKKLEKFFDHIIDCHIVMSVEKSRQVVEITLNVYEHTLKSIAESHDMNLSLDSAFQKAERQLKKFHDKLKSRKRLNRKEPALFSEEEE